MYPKTYPFLAKNLMWLVVIMFSLLTFGLLLPFTLPFAIIALRAKVVLDETHFSYTMLMTTKIAYKDIIGLKILPPPNVLLMDKGQQLLANVLAGKIIPLEITYGNGKKLKFSVNKFGQHREILTLLQQNSGINLEIKQ